MARRTFWVLRLPGGTATGARRADRMGAAGGEPARDRGSTGSGRSAAGNTGHATLSRAVACADVAIASRLSARRTVGGPREPGAARRGIGAVWLLPRSGHAAPRLSR